jgi:hypothetical protein
MQLWSVPPVTDKPSTKIALSEIATLEHLIDQAPARSASEVSKRRAIGILAPKLYELRSKGYAWRDVAAWLTEHGLAVTVPALQRYLRGVKPPAATGDPGRLTGARSKASRDGRTGSRISPAAFVERPVVSGRQMNTAASAPALSPQAKAPVPEQGKRRSEFVPRPDSEDI